MTSTPGSFFGEMSVLGQALGGGFAEATKDSLICAMSRSDVLQLLERHPSIALRVIERLGAQLQGTPTGVWKPWPISTWRRAWPMSSCSNARWAADTVHDLTQQDLAEMVGASRESVTRLLAQMGRTGLVEVKRRKIRLLDEAGLRALTDDTAAETTGASG